MDLKGQVPFEWRFNVRLVRYFHMPSHEDGIETPLTESGKLYCDFTDGMPERVFGDLLGYARGWWRSCGGASLGMTR